MTDSNTNTPKIQNILDFKTIDLPIVSILEPFKKSVNSYRNIVLNAEPGAGKTSIIPLALLPLIDKDKKILLLQPRRIAAKSTAARLAAILEQPLGECIGYRIRNESKVSRKTRIEVITEGILLRMLQADPELIDVGAIIFDEFHERNLESDLGLAFAIEVQQSIRDDLKLVIMSATLNSNALVEMLDDVSELSCEGRCFPVAVEYLPPARNSNWLGVLIEAVNKSVNFKQLNELGELENQDVLVFLPGAGEINLAKKKLDEFYSERDDLLVFPLYGSLDFKQQQRVFKRQVGYIKIVLATNIAETSLTIDGIATVIDSGLMKQSQFDPNCGFNRLETKKISKASAIQRAGRAGRLGPGKCIRLWSESDPIREQSVPDILREDLASFALDLSRWGITDPNELCLLDQPNEGALNQARSLLSGMDAIDHKLRLTEKGKLIASLGVHPRIGRMLVASIDYATVEMACLLAAMLEAKDVFEGDRRFDPDFLSRVFFVLETSRPDYQVSQIKQQANQLFQKSKKDLDFHPRKQHTLERSIPYVSQLLAHAFPDRIAIKRRNSYKLSNGTGAVLQQSFCKDSDLLVVVHLGGQSNYGGQTRNSRQPANAKTKNAPVQSSNSRIYQAVILSIDELGEVFPSKIYQHQQVRWNNASQTVQSTMETRFAQLVLASKPNFNPDKAQLTEGLLQGIKQNGLPWNNELRQLQAKVLLLRTLPSYLAEFPDLSDGQLIESLENWLQPFMTGMTKLSQVSGDVFKQALINLIGWQKQSQLEALMPDALVVASGSRIKLDYRAGDKPVLAVKLQEMFGEQQTPLVGGGKISVLIHLLSPARRPLAITEDLASFWQNGYLDVKKEMKGRYPKHPWPDDPNAAQATRYTKPRSGQ